MTPLIGLLAVLVCAVVAIFKYCQSGSDRRRDRGVILANIGEGTHGAGLITKLSGAAITGRYRIVKFGADSDHVIVTAANTDLPCGICRDEATAAELPLALQLFGQGPGTVKVLLGGTVAVGDEYIGNAAGAAIKLPVTTGTYYPVGRILQAGVSGDTVEATQVPPVARVVP